MHRREFLAASAAASALAAAPARAASSAVTAQAVADAWLAGLPLIEMAAARTRMLDPNGPGQKAGVNAFHHTRELVGAGDHTITTPNNDTLYSNSCLDLTHGPVELTVPPSPNRYLSVAVMDMYTNNNVILGARTPGGAAGRYVLVGPGQKAPAGARELRVATPHAWVLGRTLIDGEADVAAARAVQSGLVLKGPAAGPYPRYATRADEPAPYFDSVARLMASDPPVHRAGLGDLAEVRRADPGVLKEGVAQARTVLTSARGRMRFQNGWQYALPDLGDYGDDFRYRALIAVAGLGALKPQEAMYMRAAGDTGRGVFEGDGLFRFNLPRALPVDAFWSLTMYEVTPEDQFFLTANPLNRFAIGDRTPGLVKGADGAVQLWIGRRDPGGERTANWLPAPPRGPFSVTLRAYLPKPELLTGAYRIPSIVAA